MPMKSASKEKDPFLSNLSTKKDVEVDLNKEIHRR
jgi:hypothetical protein